MSELSNYSLLINLKNYNNYNNKVINGNMSIIIDSTIPADLTITYNYTSLNYSYVTDPDGNSVILSPNTTYNVTFNKKNKKLNVINASTNNKDMIEGFDNIPYNYDSIRCQNGSKFSDCAYGGGSYKYGEQRGGNDAGWCLNNDCRNLLCSTGRTLRQCTDYYKSANGYSDSDSINYCLRNECSIYPSKEISAPTTPAATTPMVTTPMATTPMATTPMATTPMATTPMATTPKATTPMATTPMATTPMATTPMATTPMATTPIATTPMATTPKATTPMVTTPMATTPMATTPMATTPVSTTRVPTTPMATTPMTTTRVPTTPMATTPMTTTPMTTTPMATTPVPTTRVPTTPIATTPSPSIPTKSVITVFPIATTSSNYMQYQPLDQYQMNQSEMEYQPIDQYQMNQSEMEYQPINSEFKAVTKTSTISPINIGDTTIDVSSTKGFEIGMYIEIGSGNNVDKCYVTNFGSIIVDRPLKYNHPTNTIIIGYAKNQIPIPTSNINLKKSDNIRLNRVLRINSDNDILNGLIGSIFRLRVNIPSLNTYSSTRSTSKVNYFYLSVEKIDPNCEIINDLQCSNVFIDYRNCTNKKSVENSKKSIYRYVLIPEYLVKKNTSFINNLNFTLEKNNNKLYLKNINTGCYPQIYKDNEKKKIFGEIVSSSENNINEVLNKMLNKSCNDTSNNLEFTKITCDYYSDKNTIIFTTNDITKCSPVSISYTDDNMINININMYNIYGSITDKLSLIYNTNISNTTNINNYDYIENVTKDDGPQKINMVKFDSSNTGELQDNILNFNVEIINFSKEIYENNVTKTV